MALLFYNKGGGKQLPKKKLQSLGAQVRARRGAMKLRETAARIGIAPATLLRIEAGRIPDVVTFGKLCEWLGVNPGEFLGTVEPVRKDPSTKDRVQPLMVSAHLKVDQTPKAETVRALSEMILRAANAQRDDSEG
jgi:transcriptional regulator with XRE-family HTH domain